jgi:hypothetical protein
MADVESSPAQTRTLAMSTGRGPRCQSLEPTPVMRRPCFSSPSHISIAFAISAWLPLVISIAAMPSGTACSHPHPAQIAPGWLMEKTPPRAVVARTRSPMRGSPGITRKSTKSRAPPIPHALAWPPGVVISSPMMRNRPSSGPGSV